MYYVGILDGGGDVWGVRIPDVPGCHGGGATPEAAIEDAISALRDWDLPLRAPRGTQDIMSDPEAAFVASAGETLVMIPYVADLGRPVRANISLDAGELIAIDAEAERRGLTRSAYMVSAAINRIGRS
jgi:hypothetical protein